MFSKTIFNSVIAVVGFLILLVFSAKMFEDLEGNNYMIVQTPAGDLECYTTPGWHLQYGGEFQKYPIRGQYEFSQAVRFNDFGDAVMIGSVQYEMPSNCDNLKSIYRLYHTKESVLDSLVKKATNKAVFQVGPLLSSRESYSEKRNDLLFWIADQIEHGVYKTVTQEVKAKDISGQDRVLNVAKIVMKDGVPERQEKAMMEDLGITTSNFAIDKLDYSNEVEAQAQAQQRLAMAVQTSIAEAKKAEQDAITTVEQGKASVAKAKYEREVEKEKAVVDANREKQVAIIQAEREKEAAKLYKLAAEETKQKNILDGQGEAEKRKLIMTADGALTQKIEALKTMNQAWASAFAQHQHRLVPDTIIVNGNDSGKGQTSAMNIMEMLQIDMAKRLAINPKVKGSDN